MSMKQTYSCNICRDEVKDPYNNLFGVNFENHTDFTLGGYASTDGSHICYRCARQLKAHLNKGEFTKILAEK